MPKLDLPPFPRLNWDGDWRGDFKVPFYKTDNKPELVVRTLDPAEDEPDDGEPGPLPTPAQIEAFQRVISNDAPLRATLTEALRKNVPQLAEADWPRIEEFLHLALVAICRTELDGESYLAFTLNQRDWRSGYDFGIGVFTHKDRVVHFGLAEETWDDGAAFKHLRKVLRTRTTAKPADASTGPKTAATTGQTSLGELTELRWEEGRGETTFSVPWYNPRRMTPLVVEGMASQSRRPPKENPQATAAQVAAYRRIVADDSTLPETLLTALRDRLPEFADQDWEDVQRVLQLEQATIFRVEHDDEAYIGFAFNCLAVQYAYEHGLGVVVHKERVVSLGFIDAAYDDGEARKDLRRLARAAKKKA